MDRPWNSAKVFAPGIAFPAAADAVLDLSGSGSHVIHHPPPDSTGLANRELIRPPGLYRVTHGLTPYSAAWYDELEQKRYQRHGTWLPSALEFGRHPGESVLLLGAGIGSDAIRYVRTGTPVTIGVGPSDPIDPLRENLNRHGIKATVVEIDSTFPVPDGSFDVVVWNGLYDSVSLPAETIAEVFRVLKAGGKVIGLFPAWYDAGFWQDLILPLQWVYWRRPVDPTTAPKVTARQVWKAFSRFTQIRIAKRHLRRAELPHLWRAMPLAVLERLLGRVLVVKALKPLTARTGAVTPLIL